MIRASVSFSALALIALSGCATPAPASAGSADSASAPLGIDLGSSRALAARPDVAPPTLVALAGEGHERPPQGSSPVQRTHQGHEDAQATGTVDAVDAAQHRLKISHDPIPAIGWPAMTMEFDVASSVDLQAVKPGTRVTFTLEKGQDGMYQVQAVKPAGAAK
jgi:Cu/Ag efflux protein CusF